MLSCVGLYCSMTPLFAAFSKITSQVLCIRAYALRYQGDVIYLWGHCPTCLHPSAPVAPPAICSNRSGLSLVCHARPTSTHRSLVVYTDLGDWANTVQTGDSDVSRCLYGTAPRFTVYLCSSCRWRSFPSTPTFFFHQRSDCSSDTK